MLLIPFLINTLSSCRIILIFVLLQIFGWETGKIYDIIREVLSTHPIFQPCLFTSGGEIQQSSASLTFF